MFVKILSCLARIFFSRMSGMIFDLLWWLRADRLSELDLELELDLESELELGLEIFVLG